MQPAHDVQLGDSQAERLTGFLDDLLDRELEAIGVTLLAGKRTELAAQDTVVRVVDVAIDDVASAIAHLALPGEVGDGTEGVQVFALEKAKRIGLGDPLAGGDLVIKLAEFALLDKKLHRLRLAEPGALARMPLPSAARLPGPESNADGTSDGPQHQSQQDTQGKIERFVGTHWAEARDGPIDDLSPEGVHVHTEMLLIDLGNLVGDPRDFV